MAPIIIHSNNLHITFNLGIIAVHTLIMAMQDLKKPLRVTFVSNGVPEEGLDEGGVSREFFQLLVGGLGTAG